MFVCYVSAINTERVGSRELLSTVIGELKQQDICDTIFCDMIHRTKKNIFFEYIIDIRDEPGKPGPTRPNPAVTLLTGYFSETSKDIQA